MLKINNLFIYFLLYLTGVIAFPALSSAAGLLTPSNANLPDLAIKKHHVDVNIADGYAVTQITQEFYNHHDLSLEAIYSFPVPAKASVGEFTYWIDGKAVTGEVVEKQTAKNIYQQEKAQGREAALAEQNSFKDFQIQVSPVLPKQSVRIRLVYIQAAHIDHAIGRYVYPLEEGGVDEEKLAFWSYNDEVTESFNFNLTLQSSYPIDSVRLPKHPNAVVHSSAENTWTIKLTNQLTPDERDANKFEHNPLHSAQQIHQLNQDIVVYWKLKQGLPGSIDMITHKEADKRRGTFMMTITPGDDLAKINRGRDWNFILDYSGSMEGKYHSLVEGVNEGLNKLNPNDRFRIILFNNNAREITSGYTPATPDMVKKYTQKLENNRPTGGTNLYAGLKLGFDELDSDRSSALILVTDGVANVGITEKQAFLRLLEQHDVRLFTFVMGNSANRPLLNSMAKISNGFAMNVSNSDDIVGKLMLATSKLTHEALHDIKLEIDGVKVRDVSPERIASVYRGQQLIVFGHYWGDGNAKVTLSGKVSGAKQVYQTQFQFPKQRELFPEIERLWAFAKIEDLQNTIDYLGEDVDAKQAIIDIAKEYGLVTPYTSMIVVRDEAFAEHNITRNNKQRVEKEHKAREQRTNQAVRNHRVDQQQPAFSANRAYPSSSGGSGTADYLILLLILFAFIRKIKPSASA